MYTVYDVRKIAPGKKASNKIASGKMLPPRKIAHPPPPGKMPGQNAPRKFVLLNFYCFLHYLTVVPFKTFYSNEFQRRI